MKRFLLIAAMICCMMPVMAQKNNEQTTFDMLKEKAKKVEQLNQRTRWYTEKLDSVVYSYGNKEELTYDNLLNCIQIKEYNMNEGWYLSRISDYAYDDQNRVISVTETEVGFEEYGSKVTVEYDAEGRISVEHMFSKVEDDWMEIHKMTFFYNNDGINDIHMYGWDDGTNSWYEMQKEEYTYFEGLQTLCLIYWWSYLTQDMELGAQNTWEYNDQRLCTKTEYYLWDAYSKDWSIINMTEYTYFDNGNLKEEVESDIYSTFGEMQYSWRTQYEYDDHDNMIKMTDYNYETEWQLDQVTDLEYDVTVPIGNVAGIEFVYLIENNYINNKLLKMTVTNTYNEQETSDYYYSANTSVNELSNHSVAIWPNPASETLNLNGDMTQVEIYGIDGRLVMSIDNGFESINVSNLAKGSYLLKATLKDGGVTTQKFLKK